MRIKDIIVEEISVTSYRGAVTDAIRNAVKHSLAQLLPKLEKLPKKAAAGIESDESNPKAFKEYVTKHLDISASLSKYILDSLNSEIGSTMVSNVDFEETDEGERGYSRERGIFLDIRYKSAVTRKIIETLLGEAYENYEPGERVKGFAFMARMAASGDRYYWGMIHYEIDRIVAAMVRTTLHELVHVMQYSSQEVKGRSGIEYRSYLDKHKGEFRSHIDDPKADLGPDETERFYNLYLSSPQEIAAFAHEAALDIISSYESNSSPEAFNELTQDDIVNAVDRVTSERFKDPKTRLELMVRKRYMKLAYLEVIRFINAQRRKSQ
jgi:hypothetical protein